MSPRLPGPDPAARAALTAALLNLASNGGTTPCWRDDRFTSDDPETREAVALECGHCPVRSQCWDAGQGELAGIWGGTDRTWTPGARRARKPEEAVNGINP